MYVTIALHRVDKKSVDAAFQFLNFQLLSDLCVTRMVCLNKLFVHQTVNST